MRSGQGRPLTHWLWFAFATYRDLAIDQIRLIAAQQLQLGSAHWPLQLDFYIGVFLKTFHSQQESVEELGSAWAAAARRLCLFQQEPAQPLGGRGGRRGRWPRLPCLHPLCPRTTSPHLPLSTFSKGGQRAAAV